MTTPSPTSCPACGAAAPSGKFCSGCGASLGPRTCTACRAELSPQARFCHRCGHPAGASPASDRKAWIIAGLACLLLVGGIAYKVTNASGPVAPDMANTGASAGLPAGPAPDISQMTPRERFDRLFNRVMQGAERGDTLEVQRFTPMALGAYGQLDSVDADARYHAAVLRMQTGDLSGARALADTILAESPGHLFGYVVRGAAARIQNDGPALARARREFLAHYDEAMRANRVEYLEHRPALEEFRNEAQK
jgi:Double zinc ribbon